MVDEDAVLEGWTESGLQPVEQLVQCLARTAHERDQHVVLVAHDSGIPKRRHVIDGAERDIAFALGQEPFNVRPRSGRGRPLR